jgi:hypothetical protein
MWRCVDLVWTDVSEERIASIFRVEKSASEESREQVVADTGSQRHIAEDGILHLDISRLQIGSATAR